MRGPRVRRRAPSPPAEGSVAPRRVGPPPQGGDRGHAQRHRASYGRTSGPAGLRTRLARSRFPSRFPVAPAGPDPRRGEVRAPPPPRPGLGGEEGGPREPKGPPPVTSGRDPLRTSRPMVEPHPPRRQRPVPFPKGRTASRRDAASVPPAAPARRAGRPPLRSQRTRGSARCRRRGDGGGPGHRPPQPPSWGPRGPERRPYPGPRGP